MYQKFIKDAAKVLQNVISLLLLIINDVKDTIFYWIYYVFLIQIRVTYHDQLKIPNQNRRKYGQFTLLPHRKYKIIISSMNKMYIRNIIMSGISMKTTFITTRV